MLNINDKILGFFLRHGTKEHHGSFFKSSFLTYKISGFQILQGHPTSSIWTFQGFGWLLGPKYDGHASAPAITLALFLRG